MATTPLRVVSLLPSATDVLGLLLERAGRATTAATAGGVAASAPRAGERGAQLVGRSHECDWPAWIPEANVPTLTRPRVNFSTAAQVDAEVKEALKSGQSLYVVDEDKLKELRPDVVLTQDICEVCSVDLRSVTRLAMSMKPQPVVLSLNPLTVEDVLRNVTDVGEAVGLPLTAASVRADLEARLARATATAATAEPGKRPNVLFIEWPDPVFVGGHWTPQLIANAGARQGINERVGEKSFAVTDEAIARDDPDLIIVAPCGLDLDATQRALDEISQSPTRASWWRGLRAVKQGRVYLVDGNHMFNRPGPRLVDAQEWLAWVFSDVDSPASARREAPADGLRSFPWRPYQLP